MVQQLDQMSTPEARGGGARNGGGKDVVTDTTSSSSAVVPGMEDVMDSWVDRNVLTASSAVFYDRDDSTKGNTNPKKSSSVVAAGSAGGGSSSQRFSGNLTTTKGSILGLPNAHHHSGHLVRRNTRRGNTSGRIFPKKGNRRVGGEGNGRNSAVPEWEPGSPMVSCFGEVKSKKERAGKSKQGRFGLFGCFSFFVCRGQSGAARRRAVESVEKDDPVTGKMAMMKMKVLDKSTVLELGSMRRFSSGRRAASWETAVVSGEDDDEESELDYVERSPPLDSEDGMIRRSRSLKSVLADLEYVRDLENVGPTSV